ncbi:MAG: hypothetical protein R3A13_08175 [Bdellovibrionota bacterium]
MSKQAEHHGLRLLKGGAEPTSNRALDFNLKDASAPSIGNSLRNQADELLIQDIVATNPQDPLKELIRRQEAGLIHPGKIDGLHDKMLKADLIRPTEPQLRIISDTSPPVSRLRETLKNLYRLAIGA